MPTKPLPEPLNPQPEAELAPEPPVKEGVDGLGPGETAPDMSGAVFLTGPDSTLPTPLLTPYSGFLVSQMSFQVQC